MYRNFERLLKENGVTAYQVSKATGISSATLSDWKKGRSTPKADKLLKIANYFGVSLNKLVNGIDEEYGGTSESGAANGFGNEKSTILIKDDADENLIAFYGECSPYLSEQDKEDIRTFMRMKAEIKKNKLNGNG